VLVRAEHHDMLLDATPWTLPVAGRGVRLKMLAPAYPRISPTPFPLPGCQILLEALPTVCMMLLLARLIRRCGRRRRTTVMDHDRFYRVFAAGGGVIRMGLRLLMLAEPHIIVRPHTQLTGLLFGDEGPRIAARPGVTTSEGEQDTQATW